MSNDQWGPAALPAGRVRFPGGFSMLKDPRIDLSQFTRRLFATDDPALQQELDVELSDTGVLGREGLRDFLREHLDNIAPTEALIVCLGVRLGESRSLAAALALDADVDAMPWPPRRREASRRMGRDALQLAIGLVDSPMLLAFSIRAEAGTTPCHHPLAFGLVAGRLGWPAPAAAEAYLQASAEAVVTAARRRLPLSTLDEQDSVAALADDIARLARRAAAAEAGEMLSFTPRVAAPV
jgi:urease accessory protein